MLLSSYTVSVQAWVAGVYKLAVTLHGEDVDASTYTITVAPAQVHAVHHTILLYTALPLL
jgi:hypothetical protein